MTVGIRVGAELAMLGKTAPGGKGEVVQSSEKTNGVIRSGASKASAAGLATQGVKGTGTKLTSAVADDFVYRNYGVGWVKVKKNDHTILLGETKYYYATEENGSLTIYYGILHFVRKLTKALSVPFESNNWPDGLEKSYLNGLKLYNPKPDYAPDIVNHSKQYEPQQQNM